MMDIAKDDPANDALAMGLRIFNTLAVLFAVYLLTGVLAPGIEERAIETSAGYGSIGALEASRMSVIALQFNPVYSALVVFECFKLLLPGMKNWETADPAARMRLHRGLLIIAFGLAWLQGWGVASALEEVGRGLDPSSGTSSIVSEPGDLFRFTFALTQVAGVAALVMFAGIITRYGIGSGYWVMLAAFPLAALVPGVAGLWQTYADGMLDPLLLIALATAILGGAAVFIALYRKSVAEGMSRPEAARDVFLPAFLGLALAGLVYSLIVLPSLMWGPGITPTAFAPDDPLRLAVLAAAIIAVALLRVADRTRALQIGAATAVISIALDIIAARTGTPLIHGDLLAIAAMICVLTWDHARARGATA